MTFTVETGAGVAGANSYVAVAVADTYFADRGGNAAWSSASTASKQAALIKATDYLDAVCSFLGTRANASQPLQWPRIGVTDWVSGLAVASNVVPDAIVKVACELAAKAAAGVNLLPDQSRGGMISSVKVGPLTVDYADGAPALPVYSVLGAIKGLTVPSDSDISMRGTPEFTGSDNGDGAAEPFFTRGMFT